MMQPPSAGELNNTKPMLVEREIREKYPGRYRVLDQ